MALNPWTRAASKTEHGEQSALFMWANMATTFGLAASLDPLSYSVEGHAKAYGTWRNDLLPLKWLYAVHNQGHGDRVRGGRAKAEGVKPGVSDVCLPVVIRGPAPLGYTVPVYWCGLYIEMKRTKGGKQSDEQKQFQAFVKSQGYKCEFANGWLEAACLILTYLGLPEAANQLVLVTPP